MTKPTREIVNRLIAERIGRQMRLVQEAGL